MSAGAERVFVDTMVLVYAHDLSAAAKRQRAEDFLLELWGSGLGCVSVQVLQEFYNAVTRKVPKPLNWQEAQGIIRDLSAWPLHSPTAEDIVRAIEIERRHSLSFWDAMIVRSAAQMQCKTVISEDLSAGQVYEGIKVVNPFM